MNDAMQCAYELAEKKKNEGESWCGVKLGKKTMVQRSAGAKGNNIDWRIFHTDIAER